MSGLTGAVGARVQYRGVSLVGHTTGRLETCRISGEVGISIVYIADQGGNLSSIGNDLIACARLHCLYSVKSTKV